MRKSAWIIAFISLLGCGDDSTEADKLGVGAECAMSDQCGDNQVCLTEFKGGYCGLADCTKDADCPGGSKCVKYSNTKNYCFRTCVDKTECNANRAVDNESNCSSSVSFVESQGQNKACVPPSGS